MKKYIPEIVVISAVVALALALTISLKRGYERHKARIALVEQPKPKRTIATKVVSNGVPFTINRPSTADDFYLGSLTAISNATFANQPPQGWSIVCDDSGHYAARSPYGTVLDNNLETNGHIRTNYFEAVVVAWRVKEIWDTPREEPRPRSGYTWKECDK